jgi:hypothetical protein
VLFCKPHRDPTCGTSEPPQILGASPRWSHSREQGLFWTSRRGPAQEALSEKPTHGPVSTAICGPSIQSKGPAATGSAAEMSSSPGCRTKRDTNARPLALAEMQVFHCLQVKERTLGRLSARVSTVTRPPSAPNSKMFHVKLLSIRPFDGNRDSPGQHQPSRRDPPACRLTLLRSYALTLLRSYAKAYVRTDPYCEALLRRAERASFLGRSATSYLPCPALACLMPR